ncbi:hypothetical protein MKY95_19215 [Paenibacillus sp. FSL P4-0176]|uniref:hypothetical protein n=1 Tax=Paenibacillus sp. FSL P4-0176 TaxID=2921631 RepID=UPI0030CC783C
MTAKSHFRGHEIEYLNGEWVFSDTKESTVATFETRPCGHCNKFATPEGHDPCLGTLPRVMNACCGHGSVSETYVQFMDTSCVRGKEAQEMIEILRFERE